MNTNSNNSNTSKRIAKNTLILYFRMLFLMLISLYTSRVVLDVLGVTDYGIYNIVGGFVAMFALISSSLTSACTRFLNYEMGKGATERINLVFSTSVSVQFLLAIIVAIVSEAVGVWYVNNIMVLPSERLYAANWCFQFSVFNFCLNLINVPYNAAIIAHEHMKAFAYVSIFEGIAKLLICYLIIISPIDKLIAYGFLLLLIQVIMRFIYQRYCIHNFEECKYHLSFDMQLVKQMFSYTGWHLVGNSAAILKKHGVNLLLNLFFGPTVNAAKGVSNQVHSAVHGFATNFMMAMNPQITQSYARGDCSYMLSLIKRGSRFSFYLLFLISLPILLSTEYIMNFWLKDVPEFAVLFTQLTLIMSMIGSLSNPLITAQNATGNVRDYQLIVGGFNLLNLPLCYVVLKFGAAPQYVMIVAISIELICLTARLLLLPKYIDAFNVRSFLYDVIYNCVKVVVCSLILPIVCLATIKNGLIKFIVVTIVSLLSTGFMILIVGCSKEERRFIINKASSFISQLRRA